MEGNIKNKPHLIDDLESAFQVCTAAITSQEYFNTPETDELKPGAEQTFQKFIDLCRQTEAFFLNKRLIVSKQKPEQVVKDETEDLRAEIERKDALIKRNKEKLQQWQMLLNNIQRGPGGSLPGAQSQGYHQGPSQGVMMPPQGPGPGHQQPPAYSQVPSALASLETMSSLGMQDRR